MEDRGLLDPEDWEAFRVVAQRAIDDTIAQVRGLREEKVWQRLSANAEDGISRPLGETGIAEEATYELVREHILPHRLGNILPRYTSGLKIWESLSIPDRSRHRNNPRVGCRPVGEPHGVQQAGRIQRTVVPSSDTLGSPMTKGEARAFVERMRLLDSSGLERSVSTPERRIKQLEQIWLTAQTTGMLNAKPLDLTTHNIWARLHRMESGTLG